MEEKLRWGFICTAHINQKLIHPIQASTNHVLQAVSSRDLQKAQDYAAKNGFTTAYGSYEELLADPNVDVVYNSLPNHLHAEWTIKACQAGKHVLCEKPLALTLTEVDAITAAARKAGVVVQEAFMYRHHPQTLKIRELLDQQVIGKIHLARGIFTNLLTNPENIRMAPEMGGGSLWDLGVYPVSYLRTMLGLEPVSAFGIQTNGASGVDMGFSGELAFPDGVMGQFQSAFNSNMYTSFEILGEKGSLLIPTPFFPYEDCEFTLIRDGLHEKIRLPGQHLYLGEIENMAACIFHGQHPLVTLEDSRANTAAILACYESARTLSPVLL